MSSLDSPDAPAPQDSRGDDEGAASISSSLPLLDEARQWMGRWDPVVNPEGPADWFEQAPGLPGFEPENPEFDPANCWWLAELCRIAYTPDAKESSRASYRHKPTREIFLEERSPFREVLNLHKTANHVSLYRMKDRPGSVLCFRGTTRFRQWLMNLTALPVSWPRCGQDDVFVHQGFQLLFERLWPLIEPHLSPETGPLIFTGHSLGAAFATMAAVVSPVRPSMLVTFGSPRIGNEAFALQVADIPTHRIVNHHDIVTLLPALDPRLGRRDFRHVGDLEFLGRQPLSFHTLSGHEEPGRAEWQCPNPLELIKNSLGKTDPPSWMVDHAPSNYAAKLRALADAPPGKPADESPSGELL